MKPPYHPGEKVGNFIVVKCMTPNTTSGIHRTYQAKCSHCGSIKYYRSSCLMKQESCGSLAREESRKRKTVHGHYYERLHRIWYSMLKRCESTQSTDYSLYGGRGIKVCAQWHDYDTFYRWAIYHGYKQSLTLERKNVNGPYSPENCVWATMRQQAQNKRNTVRTSAGISLRGMIDRGDKKGIRKYGLVLWAKAVKERANWTCELCGAKPESKYLDAHHWYATKAHCAITDILLINGVCLCRRCHIEAHTHPDKYRTKCMTIRRAEKWISRLDKLKNEGFDLDKAFEAIQRCRRILNKKDKK